MVPIYKSLNSKLLALIAFIVTAAGAFTAYYLDSAEQKRLEQRLSATLRAEALYFTESLSKEFSSHRELIRAAARRFEQDLEDLNSDSIPASSFEGYDKSKAYRRFDQHSSIFLPANFQINAAGQHELDASGKIWEALAPLVSDRFNPLFFISRHGFVRVTPAYRVAGLRNDFRPTDVPLYKLAATSIEGDEQVLQGALNFDQINSAYSVAMASQVKINGEYYGVIGGSINVSQWASILMGPNIEELPSQVMIFNDAGEMVLSSNEFLLHKNNLSEQATLEQIQAARETSHHLQRSVSQVADDTQALISSLAKGDIEPMLMQQGSIEGIPSYYLHKSFPGLDWNILLAYDVSRLDSQVLDIRRKILVSFAVLIAVLSVVLTFVLKYVFTNRVLELSKATHRLRQRQWQYRVPELGNDEVSILGSQINKMADTLADTFTDLSESVDSLQAANLKASKFISAIEHSSALVIIFNNHWQVEYTNSCFRKISGLEDTNITLNQALMLRPEDKSTEPAIKAFVEAGKEWQGEYAAIGHDTDSLWLQMLIYSVKDEDGKVVNYVATGRNVTDVKEGQIKMERLAFYDALTGLQNRLLFRDQLEREIIICQRDKSQLALMYLDLDHFKRVNDTMGHDAGDELLITVANRLRNCLRQEDAVARFGGDEFAIMLTGIGSPHYASIVANKIISELNKPIYIKTQEVAVGVSIGITLAPHDGNSLSTLFKNADLAMYQAKDKGRNSFQFFTQDMNHEIADRLALESDIKKALKNQEFILYFQPQVDLSTGRIVGAEALIRWDHSERGLRSPLEFIPMAEETGLIVPLGKWILRAACQQAKSINKGLSLRIPISVNLSARQLTDRSFVDTLSVVLQEAKLDPGLLELEVTESLLMDNIDEVIGTLGRIRDLGVRIAIDDFGTGYSSLSYIKRLPINRLKIDRTFIKDLPENQEDREITSLIIAMAKNLKLEVLAEGAETKPQVDLLTGLECDYSQGFFHSKPIPADQLMILLFERERQHLKVAG